jgi:Spy/CpxP family protein refolding chaperone
MKKTIILFTLLIFIPVLIINAQQRPDGDHRKGDPERHEKFMAMRIAYFTEQLELTSTEAEKFWPLYNEYEKDKSTLNRERRRSVRDAATQMESLTDEDAKTIIEKHIDLWEKEAELDTEFYIKLAEILPPKKIVKLTLAEIGFREYMLKQIRGDKDGSGRKRMQDHP